MNVFKVALKPPASIKTNPVTLQSPPEKPAMTYNRKDKKIVLEFSIDVSKDDLREALAVLLDRHFATNRD